MNLTRRHPEEPAFLPAGRGISRGTQRRSGRSFAPPEERLRSECVTLLKIAGFFTRKLLCFQRRSFREIKKVTHSQDDAIDERRCHQKFKLTHHLIFR